MWGTGYVARKIERGTWQLWFAWRPVKIQEKRVWLKKVYRRARDTYFDNQKFTVYEYGTLFDVIKGDE